MKKYFHFYWWNIERVLYVHIVIELHHLLFIISIFNYMVSIFFMYMIAIAYGSFIFQLTKHTFAFWTQFQDILKVSFNSVFKLLSIIIFFLIWLWMMNSFMHFYCDTCLNNRFLSLFDCRQIYDKFYVLIFSKINNQAIIKFDTWTGNINVQSND